MTDPIKGFDVSHHQDPAAVPWAELKRQGYQWCYIRAAYGTKVDRHFAEHAKHAAEADILWGAYLYLRDTSVQTTEEQVDAMLTYLGRFPIMPDGHRLKADLWPCLDIEEQDPSPGYLTGAKAAAEYLRETCGGCVIYTGAVYRVVHGLAEWSLEYPEWIADYDGPIYGFDAATPPEAHQHTGKGEIGSSTVNYGPLDLNVAHDLNALRIQPAKVEPVGDRVPELCSEVRGLAAAIQTAPGVGRGWRVGELRQVVERLADVIGQDDEVAYEDASAARVES